MRVALPGTDLSVHRLCLGGNVFGWSADAEESFALLDAYAEASGNFVDTADSYMWRVPGNRGGESETIIGDWMADRGNRDDMVVATKVGSWPEHPGLSAANIETAVQGSLRRLRTDRIDLYYAHRDDPDTPVGDSVAAFDALVRAGTVRHVAASNYSAPRLAEALAAADARGMTRFVALQPHYNLLERDFEHEQAPLLAEQGLSCLPYYGLASGFLTGKYTADTPVESVRSEAVAGYLDDRGRRVLAALAEVAEAHRVAPAAVALAWLADRPTVSTPIASARTPAQLADLLPMADLRLTAEETERLDTASDPGDDPSGAADPSAAADPGGAAQPAGRVR